MSTQSQSNFSIALTATRDAIVWAAIHHISHYHIGDDGPLLPLDLPERIAAKITQGSTQYTDAAISLKALEGLYDAQANKLFEAGTTIQQLRDALRLAEAASAGYKEDADASRTRIRELARLVGERNLVVERFEADARKHIDLRDSLKAMTERVDELVIDRNHYKDHWATTATLRNEIAQLKDKLATALARGDELSKALDVACGDLSKTLTSTLKLPVTVFKIGQRVTTGPDVRPSMYAARTGVVCQVEGRDSSGNGGNTVRVELFACGTLPIEKIWFARRHLKHAETATEVATVETTPEGYIFRVGQHVRTGKVTPDMYSDLVGDVVERSGNAGNRKYRVNIQAEGREPEPIWFVERHLTAEPRNPADGYTKDGTAIEIKSYPAHDARGFGPGTRVIARVGSQDIRGAVVNTSFGNREVEFDHKSEFGHMRGWFYADQLRHEPKVPRYRHTTDADGFAEDGMVPDNPPDCVTPSRCPSEDVGDKADLQAVARHDPKRRLAVNYVADQIMSGLPQHDRRATTKLELVRALQVIAGE